MLTLLMPPSCEEHEEVTSVPLTRPAALKAPTGEAWLLVEAIGLAERFGYEVIEAELEDEPPGLSWHRGHKRLWLDLKDRPEWRLAALADVLRGEAGIFYAEMSPELADYLAPRRAA